MTRLSNPAEEIQAAIDKLTRQRELANEGPWMHRDGGDVVMGSRSDPVEAYPMVAECDHLNDADLIVTLHATIDAQLAILGHVLEHYRGDLGISTNRQVVALARAINGGA